MRTRSRRTAFCPTTIEIQAAMTMAAMRSAVMATLPQLVAVSEQVGDPGGVDHGVGSSLR